MPAVIGPAPGGLSYWQTVDLLHGLAAKATIAGFDIVYQPAEMLTLFGLYDHGVI